MILQALHELYKRLPDIDPPGFAQIGVSWAIVLSPEGKLLRITSLRQPAEKGNKTYPLSLSAPTIGKRTSAAKANFLVDKSDYIFGVAPEADEKIAAKLLERFDLFKELHLRAQSEVDSPGLQAVCAFLGTWDPRAADAIDRLCEAAGVGFEELNRANFVFQLSGVEGYVHQEPSVRQYWANSASASADQPLNGFCLVTGEHGALAKLHAPAIKGVIGAQSSGASIVSFNLPAFTSYGKEQSLNAPVSEAAAFAYCTVLNHLLADRSRRLRIGDTTTVFWTEKPAPIETDLLHLLTSEKPESESVKQRVEKVLSRIAIGKLGRDDLGDATTRFYLLGLAPNASRLSIRFWYAGNLEDLAENLQKHHNDLRIIRQFEEDPKIKHPDPAVPSIFDLLRQTARESDGIPPLLSGALMRAILLGSPYPQALINAVMTRIHADRDVNYLKAAILKAWLVRNHSEPVSIMLDESNPNTGYRLGRLFALLEKTQLDALGNVNAPIGDRYYTSASSTPRAVFARLLAGYKHHIAKLEGGLKTWREKAVQDVLDPVSDFPAHLPLADQAQFALGYYHQRKALYSKADKPLQAPAESLS